MRPHRIVRIAIALCASLAGMGVAPSRAQGQGAIVTGRVTTEFGTIVPAEVVIEELGMSAMVGEDGRYTLAIPSARLLRDSVRIRVRAMSYRFQDRTIALREGTQTEDFVLTKDVNRLNAVIVVGTSTPTESRKLPYSVTRLDTSDTPVRGVNALSAIQGKIPGALIVQPSGRPGTGPAFVFRGPKSINADDGGLGATTACLCPLRLPGGRSQEPLIIVDGVILNTGVQDLNPDDIESIEVIKGAAASTLWGSRAGAGVIQLTTKRASLTRDGISFSIRSEYGMNDVQGEYPFARRHLLLMDETNRRFCMKVEGQPSCSRVIDFEEEQRRINDVYSPAALPPYLFERDYSLLAAPPKRELRGLFQVNQWPVSYNPIAQVATNGALFTNSADLAGRSGSTSYYSSLSSVSQEGAFRYLRGYRRSSGRLNVDQTLGEGSDVRLTSAYTRGRLYGATSPTGGNRAAVSDEWFQGITRVPAGVDLRQRDSRGRLFIRPNPLVSGSLNTNPLYAFENLDLYQDDDRFTGSLSARYVTTSWLSFDATASADRRRTFELGYMDRDYRTVAEFGQNQGGTRGFIAETVTSDLSSNVMLGSKAAFTLGDDLRGAVITRYSTERQDRQHSWAKGQELAYSGLVTLANATTGIGNFSARTRATAIGIIGGGQLEYRDRYIFDGLIRYDGSSLFGAAERWHPYFRGSVAWRLSDEPFWGVRSVVNDLKLRGSVGSAGGRPNAAAQYETFALSGGGAPQTMGNRFLKPEHTLETEVGADAELFHRVGVSLTYARDITSDQLLIVPAPVASGFTRQWQNAGTLDGRTWEFSLRLPIMTMPDFSWSAQVGWDRQRTYISALNTLPFEQLFSDNLQSGYSFLIQPGMRFGTMYGRRLATSCSELPKPFDAQCGPGREWQPNDDGYIVWVGEGRSWRDGITHNLWQAVRPGCVSATGTVIAVQGEVECQLRGGSVNSPWGLLETSWGMPTVLRDSTATLILSPLGNTMPDYRVTLSQSVRWRRLSLYALLDASVGNRLFNSERRWSYVDFMAREQDQDGATVETAKPIGYYWRGGNNPQGIGGFYLDNRASNHTVEDASYRKLREVQISLDLPRISFLPGTWIVALSGRNLYTWTRYSGWDPEAGNATSSGNGSPNSAAITTGDAFAYPQTRTFTLAFRGRI